MRVSFEVNWRIVTLHSVAGFLTLAVLHGAYPKLFEFWPSQSSDLASWVQAVGSLVALGVAIWAPWYSHQRELAQQRLRQFNEADLLIKFHRGLFEANEAFLEVAIAHLPNGHHANHCDAREQILDSIASLRSLDFEQVRTIGLHDQTLGMYLADFHCELEMLVGMLERNGDDALAKRFVMTTVISRVGRLAELSREIRSCAQTSLR